jgi:hypothetical protein
MGPQTQGSPQPPGSKMGKLKIWQRWGLYGVSANLALALVAQTLDRIHWWYQETIWYEILIVVDHPIAEIERVFLNSIHVPRLYDVPLTWRESVIIHATGLVLSSVWWFLLGAVFSVAWAWAAKRIRAARYRE